MPYGLLDLPKPLYNAIDGLAAQALPASLRVVIWAVLAGAASMALYWLLSPQRRIGAVKAQAADARRALRHHEGDFSEAMPLIRAQLGASLRQIGLVLPSTLIASLPVLTTLIWMDTHFARTLPEPQAAPSVEVEPADFQAQWSTDGAMPSVVVMGADGDPVLEIPVVEPIPVVEKPRWWNWLIGNPLGYLPDEGQLTRVTFELPARSYLPFGPEWMRSWLMLFFPALLVTSIVIFRVGRIH